MDIILVTGLSGAGKSKAVDALEDIGYFCIDNIPPELIPTFAQIALQAKTMNKIAVVTDVRSGDMFAGIYDCIKRLKSMNLRYKILFLDAENDVLVHRFKETRRKHPLSIDTSLTAEQAIIKERELLLPLYEVADYKINTGKLSVAQLRSRIISLFHSQGDEGFQITVISFGFKYGLPTEADLVFDVRCLVNPFYVDELKDKTGLDSDVMDYIMKPEETGRFINSIYDFLDTSTELYRAEGKTELVIAVGCTGGKHRSVAVAELIANHLFKNGYRCEATHRDMGKLL